MRSDSMFVEAAKEDVPEITVLSEENAETAGQSMPMPAAGGSTPMI